ncbi:MAG: hypothetical protein R3B93_04355 [Bacteroidia bacterium]
MKKPDILQKYVSLRDEMDWVAIARALEATNEKRDMNFRLPMALKGKVEEAGFAGDVA